MTVETHDTTPVAVKPARHETHAMRRLFHEEVDRMFDRLWGGWPTPFDRFFERAPAWREENTLRFAGPAVDVFEDDLAYVISTELPGLEEKDISVSLSGDVLILKGERRSQQETSDKDLYVSERAYGAFQRSFALPRGVDREKISAELSKG